MGVWAGCRAFSGHWRSWCVDGWTKLCWAVTVESRGLGEVLEQAMLHSEMVTPTPRSHDEAESRVSHTCESGYHKPLAASWLNQGNIQVFSEMNPLLLLAGLKRHWLKWFRVVLQEKCCGQGETVLSPPWRQSRSREPGRLGYACIPGSWVDSDACHWEET